MNGPAQKDKRVPGEPRWLDSILPVTTESEYRAVLQRLWDEAKAKYPYPENVDPALCRARTPSPNSSKP